MFWKLTYIYNGSPFEYLESTKVNKYCVKLNVELGCYNNLIKNYKTFDYIKMGGGQFKGIGISSIYVPIPDFIEFYGLNEVISTFQSQMKKNNLGIYMVITKEFRTVNAKKILEKEILFFADQKILCDTDSRLWSLIVALENDKDL